MNRRALLATLGTATVATAGCLGDGGDRPNDDDEPSPDETDTDTPGGDGTRTDDGDPRPETPFADAECPSFSEGVDRTVCWPTDETDAESVYLDASSVAFEPSPGDGSVESIEFVLHNESGEPFGLNPHAWAIKRQTDSGWEHVAPEEWIEPWYTVESGQRYTWRLSVEQRTQAMAERTMAITEDLTDGTYAFQITGIAGESGEDSRNVECIALFEVQRRE